MPEGLPLLMDRAYEGNQTRQLVLDLGMMPVVPPKSNRVHRWEVRTAPFIEEAQRNRTGCSSSWKGFLLHLLPL